MVFNVTEQMRTPVWVPLIPEHAAYVPPPKLRPGTLSNIVMLLAIIIANFRE